MGPILRFNREVELPFLKKGALKKACRQVTLESRSGAFVPPRFALLPSPSRPDLRDRPSNLLIRLTEAWASLVPGPVRSGLGCHFAPGLTILPQKKS